MTLVASLAETVDVRPIKALATQLLPASSLLRRVLSSEPDRMPPADYLAKLGTWLALLREEMLA